MSTACVRAQEDSAKSKPYNFMQTFNLLKTSKLRDKSRKDHARLQLKKRISN